MPVANYAGRNLLFIHVPKTGGTSVESLLGRKQLALYDPKARLPFPCSPQHFHGAILELLFPPQFFESSFMVVRDPYERIKSEYRMRHRRFRGKTLQFRPWIEEVFAAYQNNSFILDNHIRPQSEFIAFSPKIFHLEKGLAPVAEFIACFIGAAAPQPPPRLHASKVALEIDESRECRALIDQFYEADYRIFGYQPDRAPVHS